MRPMFIALLIACFAVPAVAKPHLRDVAEIDDTLLSVGLADEIRKNCPSISARMLKALALLHNLKGLAEELGYSAAEIEAYVDSDAEKARLRAEGHAWFAANGVRISEPETYCAAGRAEIQKNSQIGALLRAN